MYERYYNHWIERKHETISRKRRTSEPWTWNMNILWLRSMSFPPIFLYSFLCIRKSYLEHDVNYTVDPREKIWELTLQTNTWWWKCCVCEWCGKCSTFPMRKQTLLVYTLLKTEHKGEYAFKKNDILFFFLKWAP